MEPRQVGTAVAVGVARSAVDPIVTSPTATLTATVTTRKRAADIHDVFLHFGGDEPFLLGQITGRGRSWTCGGLIYAYRSGAALDLARRTLAKGGTPYSDLYGGRGTARQERRLRLEWAG